MKASRKKTQGRLTLALILAGAAAFGFWQYLSTRPIEKVKPKILFYQDSMHPWIKSDQPGKCTICLMDLTPIQQGDQGFADSADTVMLSSNSITVMNVQTEEVRRGTLHRVLRVAGTLEADNTRKTILAAPAPGRIDNVTVPSAGMDVKQGQVLATFYSPELTFQTRRYIFRDRLTEMSGSSGMNMAAAGGGSSRHTPTFGTSKTQPLPATERGEGDPFYNDLLATLGGTVVERSVFNGQYVAEGDRLFTIVDLSVLWFRFDIYEQQLAWIEPGQKVTVSVPSLPGHEFPAVISVIEPALNETTRTIKVRADVSNALRGPEGNQRRLLRLGMYAEGLIRAELPEVLTVPRTAVLFPGGSAFAYVDKGGGAFAMRRVQPGRQGDTQWEILDGLDEGERVVIAGNVLIDAQAQFNRGGEATEGAEPPSGSEAPGNPEAAPHTLHLTDVQRQAAERFLEMADGISSALAGDNVARVQEHARHLASRTEALAGAFAGHSLAATANAIHGRSAWKETADLASARKAFLPFSTAVVEFVQGLRDGEKQFASARVYHCPMAPEPGLWYQARGPLRNPYFGAQMLSCGEEVRGRPARAEPTKAAMTPQADTAACCENSGAISAVQDVLTPAEVGPPSTQTPATPRMTAAPMLASAPQKPPAISAQLSVATRRTAASSAPTAPHAGSRVSSPATATPASSPDTKAPAESADQVIGEFIGVVDAISTALAGDDLTRYQKAVAGLPGALEGMQKMYPAPHRWNTLLQRLSLLSDGKPASSLEMARKRFLLFSTNASELIRQLRKENQAFAHVKVYKCSMAPAPGTWVQAKPPLRNPYFGAGMLTCGEEVPL